MREHPILFKSAMVQAIIEGRKTMTRRVFKTQPPTEYKRIKNVVNDLFTFENDMPPLGMFTVKCPYGKVGDVLWVRETWAPFIRGDKDNGYIELIKFAADGFEKPFTHDKDYSELGWHKRPSIHMPRAACRLFLEITNIRVERLQDISEADAKEEGVKIPMIGDTELAKYKTHFSMLWEQINGEESWNVNPWVWVVEFKRVKE